MEQILALYHSTENRLSSTIVIDLVKRATSNKKIFGYAELYEPLRARLPMLDLTPQAHRWVDILQIFTYGQWRNYKEFLSDSMDDSLPELTAPQVHKLKQLTLLSLCAVADVVPYSTIKAALDLDAEELEPLIIDTVYSGQLTAKLDTAAQAVEVTEVCGRDVDSARLAEICATLDEWEAKTALILKTTQAQIAQTRSVKTARGLELDEYNLKLAAKKDEKGKLGNMSKRNKS